MRIPSQLLASFFKSDQDPGDSTLLIPQVLLPVIQLSSPFGPFIRNLGTAILATDPAQEESCLFEVTFTRTNQAASTLLFGILAPGVWDLHYSLSARNVTAMGFPYNFPLEMSGAGTIPFDVVQLAMPITLGAANSQNGNFRISAQRKTFLHVFHVITSVSETLNFACSIVANRLQ